MVTRFRRTNRLFFIVFDKIHTRHKIEKLKNKRSRANNNLVDCDRRYRNGRYEVVVEIMTLVKCVGYIKFSALKMPLFHQNR